MAWGRARSRTAGSRSVRRLAKGAGQPSGPPTGDPADIVTAQLPAFEPVGRALVARPVGPVSSSATTRVHAECGLDALAFSGARPKRASLGAARLGFHGFELPPSVPAENACRVVSYAVWGMWPNRAPAAYGNDQQLRVNHQCAAAANDCFHRIAVAAAAPDLPLRAGAFLAAGLAACGSAGPSSVATLRRFGAWRQDFLATAGFLGHSVWYHGFTGGWYCADGGGMMRSGGGRFPAGGLAAGLAAGRVPWAAAVSCHRLGLPWPCPNADGVEQRRSCSVLLQPDAFLAAFSGIRQWRPGASDSFVWPGFSGRRRRRLGRAIPLQAHWRVTHSSSGRWYWRMAGCML